MGDKPMKDEQTPNPVEFTEEEMERLAPLFDAIRDVCKVGFGSVLVEIRDGEIKDIIPSPRIRVKK